MVNGSEDVNDAQNGRILSEIKKGFPNIFPGANNEPIKQFEVSILIKEGATPIFYKAYIVPYALRDEVEDGLKSLESKGVISKVEYSEWASPAVCVPRKNGKLRLCADLKVTVNRFVNINQYPFPIIEDIFNSVG